MRAKRWGGTLVIFVLLLCCARAAAQSLEGEIQSLPFFKNYTEEIR